MKNLIFRKAKSPLFPLHIKTRKYISNTLLLDWDTPLKMRKHVKMVKIGLISANFTLLPTIQTTLIWSVFYSHSFKYSVFVAVVVVVSVSRHLSNRFQ